MTQAKHKTPSLELDGVIGFNGTAAHVYDQRKPTCQHIRLATRAAIFAQTGRIHWGQFCGFLRDLLA
jgi:hypothetical protein